MSIQKRFMSKLKDAATSLDFPWPFFLAAGITTTSLLSHRIYKQLEQLRAIQLKRIKMQEEKLSAEELLTRVIQLHDHMMKLRKDLDNKRGQAGAYAPQQDDAT